MDAPKLGDRREPIFHDDQDRQLFLEAVDEVCAKTGWQLHAVCLNPNHFHLVVETPQANPVAGLFADAVDASGVAVRGALVGRIWSWEG